MQKEEETGERGRWIWGERGGRMGRGEEEGYADGGARAGRGRAGRESREKQKQEAEKEGKSRRSRGRESAMHDRSSCEMAKWTGPSCG